MNSNHTYRYMRLQRDFGLLATLAIGLFAALWTVGRGLPDGPDTEQHIYLLVELDYLIRHGVFYSRWNPFLGYGYGLPLNNYYPQLLSYVSEPWMLLGLGPLVGLRITLGIALVAGTTGAYLWVRDLFGRMAGFVAATAFIFSPYVMYTLLERAGFPEIVALGLMPWGLWAMHRYVRRGRLIFGVISAVIVAALLLTHLMSAYVFAASLAVYILALAWPESFVRSTWIRNLARLSWPVLLGFGLSAFVWLPAMFETDLIQIERILRYGDPSRSIGAGSPFTLFQLSAWPGASAPRAAMSSVTLMLALMGGAAAWALRATRSRGVALVALLLVGGAFVMQLQLSQEIWRVTPMLKYAQWPRRFLGVGALWLALLAGVGVAALTTAILSFIKTKPVFQMLFSAVLAVGVFASLMLFSLGWRFQTLSPAARPLDLQAVMEMEQGARRLGFTFDWVSPRALTAPPKPATALASTATRLDEDALPAEVEILNLRFEPLRYRLTMAIGESADIRFRTAYFPGWRAESDGQALALYPDSETGLLAVTIPPGRHTIDITLTSTPTQRFAGMLSFASVLVLSVLSAWRVLPRRVFRPTPQGVNYEPRPI